MAPKFLTSVLDWDERSASRPGRCAPRGTDPGTHCTAGCVDPRVCLNAENKGNSLSPTGNRTSPVEWNNDWWLKHVEDLVDSARSLIEVISSIRLGKLSKTTKTRQLWYRMSPLRFEPRTSRIRLFANSLDAAILAIALIVAGLNANTIIWIARRYLRTENSSSNCRIWFSHSCNAECWRLLRYSAAKSACESSYYTLVSCSADFRPWSWRWYVPPKNRFTNGLQGAEYRIILSRLRMTLSLCVEQNNRIKNVI
jgi:hypothetical protein